MIFTDLTYRTIRMWQIALFSILFLSISIQVTNIHNELFKVFEVENLELGSEGHDEGEFDEELMAIIFTEKEFLITTKAKDFELVFGDNEIGWISPFLEVPVRPPLNS